MSRIDQTMARLREEGQVGLIAYVTVGYPDVDATLRLVPALAAGGADMVELGVPFSDPLADGTTIQRASHHALQQGVTPAVCLDVVKQLRARGLAIPLLLMGYYNPILAYGIEEFARDVAGAGADGLIGVDLPPEEAAGVRTACAGRGLDLIYLVAPTSSDERIALVAGQSSGFLYCVSLTGVTGARGELPSGLSRFLARVRRHTSLPLAVGFGISKREHVEAVAGLGAEAAVIGSAIINVIDRAPAEEREERVREYVEVVTGQRKATI
ncbi:MAG: tryptophan synthase subunit alpha [Dehalococcoidia bacterium]|nr:MAG: tryptophan synthase subunit alpha [Dehalococcoidia bacterium]